MKKIVDDELLEKNIIVDIKENNDYNDSIKDEIIKIIREVLISLEIDNYNNYKEIISKIKKDGKYQIFEDQTICVSLTTPEKENENKNKNVTTINLGECEAKLKEDYSIPKNEDILISKMEILKEDIKIPIIEYEVYYPLYGKKLERVDLSKCEGIKINTTFYKIIEKEDIDKHNSSSDYYKNICYKATTTFGTDINLHDRKSEFFENNMNVCEENCDFIDYELDNKKVVCSCDVKKSLFERFADININTTKLLNNFVDIKNIINLNVIKCYESLFKIDGIKNNIGFWVNSPVVLFHIMSVVLFYAKEKKVIIKLIEDIIYAKKAKKQKEKFSNKNIDNTKKKYKNNQTNKKIKKKNNKKKKTSAPIKKEKSKKKKEKNNRKTINIIQTSSNTNTIINNNYILNIKNKSEIKNILENKDKNNDKKIELIMAYNICELNDFSYKDALNFDKRSYFQYYLSLLKTNHLLISSFYPVNDYNSRIIKIFLFFFLFIVYFFVNGLFFNDSTTHEIYKDKGKYDFVYQLPQIIYSSFISFVINTIIKFLALSEKNILKIKRFKNKRSFNDETDKIKKFIFYKFIAFFFVSFGFLIFFWYYLSCFCNIYENSQIHLIKDTIISFCLSLLYSLFIYLIPGIFRSISLQKKNNKCMYKFSQILQII